MSPPIASTTCSNRSQAPNELGRVTRWLARRRIALSLVGFISLVAFNFGFRGIVPYNPLAIHEPLVQLAIALLLSGLGIRSWSAGTLNKSRELTTDGPYALIRNPLYVGSFLMMFAFCLIAGDLLTVAFVLGPLAALYRVQVGYEEHHLEQLFPAQWPSYAAATPRFLPRYLSSAIWRGWSLREWLRNREYRAVGAACAIVIAMAAWQQLVHH